jgi:hypothetical protein
LKIQTVIQLKFICIWLKITAAWIFAFISVLVYLPGQSKQKKGCIVLPDPYNNLIMVLFKDQCKLFWYPFLPLVFERVNDLYWSQPALYSCSGRDYFGVAPDQVSRRSPIYLPEI